MKDAQPRISIIAALSSNRVIGRDGALPWRLPDDFKYFKRLTTGHTLVMGRRTFESLGGPLPDRRHIVLTRQRDWRPAFASSDLRVVHSLDEALKIAAKDEGEIFIIGGEQIFREALPRADRLYLTQVRASVEGDTSFPEIDNEKWERVEHTPHPPDSQNPYSFAFERYERKK